MNSEETSRYRSLIFFSFSLYIFLTCIRLVTLDIFMDGVTYSAIARNLSIGLGSFWDFHYTNTLYNHWYDFPPLSIYLQSFLFRFFGDYLILDSLWGMFIGLFVLVLIMYLWKIFNPEKKSEWYPVLLFLVIPMVPWAFTNNILENLLTVFTLLAVIFTVLAIQKKTIFAVFSSVFIVFAFITKGLPSLFPFIVPFLYLVLGQIDFKKTFRIYFYMVMPFLLIMSYFLFINKSSAQFFNNYLFGQVLTSLSGKREIAGSRFYILWRLFLELIVPVVLVLIFSFLAKIKVRSFKDKIDIKFIVMLSIAFSASLPIMMSPKQSGHYLFPSLPYFAILIAYASSDLTIILLEKINSRVVVFVSILLLVSAIIIPAVYRGGHAEGRHPDFNKDVLFHAREIKLPYGENVFVCPQSLFTDWGVVAEMNRLFISSFVTDPNSAKYRLIDLLNCSATDLNKCKKLQTFNPKRYLLLECF